MATEDAFALKAYSVLTRMIELAETEVQQHYSIEEWNTIHPSFWWCMDVLCSSTFPMLLGVSIKLG
jgi:hypothetical protein